VRDPARDHHFLLVAAAEPAHLGGGARVDAQALHGGVDARQFRAHAQRPPVAQAARHRQRDVFAHGPLAQQCPQAVGRHQHEAGADRVRRVAEFLRAAIDQNLARVGPPHAGEAVEQFLLALAFQRRNPQNFARMQPERDVAQQRSGA